jgi:hypothetical protein
VSDLAFNDLFFCSWQRDIELQADRGFVSDQERKQVYVNASPLFKINKFEKWLRTQKTLTL